MRNWLVLLAIMAASSISGCSRPDLYDGPGTWRPEGSNAGNLAAMVERPSDLIRGRTDRSAEIFAGQDAVLRIWQDRVRPLPDGSSSGASSGSAATGKDSH